MSFPRASFDTRSGGDDSLAPSSSLGLRQNVLSFSATTRFILASAGIYFVTSVVAVLTLHPYFSQTWDVATFIQAARTFLNGTWLSLYEQSRLAQTWPYAYPPLHALFVAPFLLLPFPDYVMARVPALCADIALGILLYRVVATRTNDVTLARAALLVWLFNPLTFYDTVVQGHFEAEWLCGVVLAYALAENPTRGILLPTVALAFAVLVKQVAILFALPLWWLYWRASPRRALASVFLFGVIVSVVSLPFILYSPDYFYMNVTYVANVPLQTQAWLVLFAGVNNFPLIQYSSFVSILAAGVITLIAARRAYSLSLTATLIALAFFLTSKKVMGYYYAVLFPFLIVEFVPRRRFDLIAAALGITTFIALSPYFASWADQTHWIFYAALGILDSALLVWLFAKIISMRHEQDRNETEMESKEAVGVALSLFLFSALAAFAQPVIASATSPIRAPLVAPNQLTLAYGVALALVLACALIYLILARVLKYSARANAWTFALLPLFFLTYTLTKESTTAFELILKAIGL